MPPQPILLCTIFVVFVGSLLHFVWEWSGQSAFVAIFAATNESTWEHLKMAFWPALWIAPYTWWHYQRPPGFVIATLVRTVLPPILIVVLFYSYKAILGHHSLWLDIGVFVIAIAIGEVVGHKQMMKAFRRRTQLIALLFLAAATLAFMTLTFAPPNLFLFQEPTQF